MTIQGILNTVAFVILCQIGIAQENSCKIKLDISVDKKLQKDFIENGRIYFFLSQNKRSEPYTQTFPFGARTHIFAQNIASFKSANHLKLEHDDQWISTVEWDLNNVPTGKYYVQVLWDHDIKESRINAPGNLYSSKELIDLTDEVELQLILNQVIESTPIIEHELAKEVEFKSELLSSFWNKPMTLKAAILLPRNYDPKKAYPIRYNVAGYGGRYHRINRQLGDKDFMKWWQSDEAPEIISVYLDGEGPFGDSYQLDSENSGPYGEALVTELIPFIEEEFRGTNTPENRFVDGCSTGGWVSLGLQIYYPDVFDGCFSYSPDAVDFENYQLINIYKDPNAFVNEFGYDRPVMRMPDGEPVLTLKDFLQYENVLGSSNTYLNSGGQFSAHAALYSPKGENGLPRALIDPTTGDIDHEVAEHWKKYDFKLYLQKNWNELGPKLADKIYIWMGDMDHFYLNYATHEFASFLEGTDSPKSDAVIDFAPYEGHCNQYSHKAALIQIQNKIDAKNE